jgi:FkbM family methyltransferase
MDSRSGAEEHADGPLARVLWSGLIALGRVTGPGVARTIAAVVLRIASRTPTGYRRSMLRVARRTPLPLPNLTRLPMAWWTYRPHVQACRLGLRFDLDLRDNLQRTLYFTGRYEPALTDLLLREVRRGDVVLDIGAHIGVHALVTARRLRDLGGGRVIAVEPTPDSVAALRRVAVRHGLRVRVVEMAFGRQNGVVPIRADPEYGDADAGVRSQFTTGTTVTCALVVTLDDWAEHDGPDRLDIIKIDVEGAEPDVLAGATRSLRRCRPRLVVVEVKDRILARAGTDAEAVRRPLREAGYRCDGVVDGNEVWRA